MNTSYDTLSKAVKDYLSEIDHPVPDPAYRKVLRDRLRKLVGAPAQPLPDSRRRK